MPDIPSTAGFITLGDVPDIPSTAGFITIGDVPDIPSTAGFITLGDVPDIPSTEGFITSGDVATTLEGYATTDAITSFITAGAVTSFITAGAVDENVGFNAISGFFESTSAWFRINANADKQKIVVHHSAIFNAVINGMQAVLVSHGSRLDDLTTRVSNLEDS